MPEEFLEQFAEEMEGEQIRREGDWNEACVRGELEAASESEG